MGLLFVEVLPRNGDGGPAAAVLKCRQCRVDAASADAIVSRDFRGRFGRAYLFDHVVNVSLGPNEDRYLITGLHTVKDIYTVAVVSKFSAGDMRKHLKRARNTRKVHPGEGQDVERSPVKDLAPWNTSTCCMYFV